MFHWFGVVQNTRGDALGGWQVGLVSGSSTVSIFSDRSGTPIASVSGVANRAVADENGNYSLFVPSGTYTIQFYNSSGVFQRQIVDVPMYTQDTASPEDYSGTDTEKFQAALATGKPVTCRSSAYAITDSLTLAASGQIVDLNGALITATGGFDLFEASGGIQGCVIRNGRIEGAALSSGYVLNVTNADRFTLENMVILNPFNFAFVQKANVVEMKNVWVNNIRGSYGIRWLGDAANRSDVLRLIGVTMSFPDAGTGIEWDGNCHTLQTFGVIIVRPNKGLRILNTAGATAPEFGFFTNIEIDFPVSYGVEILSGESYYFGPQFYCQGSTTASGVYVASGLAPDRITFAGGKIAGNATYGIENRSRVLVCNLLLDSNTTADYFDSDDAVIQAPRFEVDNTFVLKRDGSGNPSLDFDATDYIGYSRSANDMIFVIGGNTVATASATRFLLTQPPQLPVTTVSGLPAAGAGNAGREYYVSDANATTRLAIVAGGGANFVKVFSNGTNWLIA